MRVYRHTQPGTPVLVVAGGVFLLLVALVTTIAAHPIAMAVVFLLLLCLVLFNSLTVEVTDAAVRVRFGPGPIGRSFRLSDIGQVRTVRNPWYYGWGIRWFPHGWLFNVSGFDAVELTMLDGRVFRIGTDQPRELLAAIERARGIAG